MNRQETKMGEYLGATACKGKALRWCVIGAGNGGLTIAGILGMQGFHVTLYNRTDENLNGVRWHGGITVTGEMQGFGPVHKATAVMEEALEGADVIMVVTPSTAHYPLAKLMAPHLVAGQIILLNPGRTGGALEFRHTLEKEHAEPLVMVAEAQTFLFASRAISRQTVRIHRIKNSVPVASLPAYWIPQLLAVLNQAFPAFVAGNSILSTSLENIGAVFHPALTLLNAGWIEATHGGFEFYLQGITPSTAAVLEKIDSERVAVASSLGVHSVSSREWLYLSYDSPGADLYSAIKNTAGYKGIMAPSTIMHRYISEDVPMSLVPISSIGRMLGVATPTIDMMIELGSAMHGTDYRAQGRTVERLGIAGMSVKEIRQMVVGIAPRTTHKKESDNE